MLEAASTSETWHIAKNSHHHTHCLEDLKFPFLFLLYLGRFTRIQDWIPFLYVDVSELPLMTAKWQHAPPWIDALKYNVAVYSNNELRENETYEGPFPMASELHYLFYPNSVPGTYHFELAIISNSCDSNICHISRSPDIVVGKCSSC